MRTDIHSLIDLLTEYENGELDEKWKAHLKDELLDLSEQLHDEGIEEGWRYDNTMILIKKGKPLPQPYKGMRFENTLSGNEQVIKIKEITGLRRNKAGELVVEALVKRINHED